MPFSPETEFFTCPPQGGSGQNLVTKGDNATCNQLKAVQERQEEMFQYYFGSEDSILYSINTNFLPSISSDVSSMSANSDSINEAIQLLNPESINQPIVAKQEQIFIFFQGLFFLLLLYMIGRWLWRFLSF